jgi:hypothetical protein
MTVFLDIAPAGGGTAVFLAVAFFLVFAAVAFIAFKVLKRTVKMAFRMAIVAIILIVAIVGSIAFWAYGTGGSERPKPRITTVR